MISLERLYKLSGDFNVAQEGRTDWSEVQLKYITWLSVPEKLRPDDLQTRADIADALGLGIDTLYTYEITPLFWLEVYQRARNVIGHELTDILQAMATRAKAGSVQAAKLCLHTLGVQNEVLELRHQLDVDSLIIERPAREEKKEEEG